MWAIRKNDLKCMLLVFQKERKGKKKKWKLGVSFIFLMLLSKYPGFYYFFKNADHYLTSYMKINSRWINEFNVRNKITKPSR